MVYYTTEIFFYQKRCAKYVTARKEWIGKMKN